VNTAEQKKLCLYTGSSFPICYINFKINFFVRPLLEHSIQAWRPHYKKEIDLIEGIQGYPIDVIYLELQKAFDKVSLPHKRLLMKINAMGITGDVFN